jgi:hypothetical protein
MLQAQSNFEVGALLKAYAQLSSRAAALTLTETKIVTRADPQLLYVSVAADQEIQLPAISQDLVGLTQLISNKADSLGSVVVKDSLSGTLATVPAGGLYRFLMLGALSAIAKITGNGTLNFSATVPGLVGNSYSVVIEEDVVAVPNPGDAPVVTFAGNQYTVKVNTAFTNIQQVSDAFNVIGGPVLCSYIYGESNVVVNSGMLVTAQLQGGLDGFWQVQNLMANSGTEAYSLPFAAGEWLGGTTLTIAAATHGSLQPRPQVYSLGGGLFRPIIVDVTINATNGVILTVASGSAFDGKVVIL